MKCQPWIPTRVCPNVWLSHFCQKKTELQYSAGMFALRRQKKKKIKKIWKDQDQLQKMNSHLTTPNQTFFPPWNLFCMRWNVWEDVLLKRKKNNKLEQEYKKAVFRSITNAYSWKNKEQGVFITYLQIYSPYEIACTRLLCVNWGKKTKNRNIDVVFSPGWMLFFIQKSEKYCIM